MKTSHILGRAMTKLGGIVKVAEQTKAARKRWLDDSTLDRLTGVFTKQSKAKPKNRSC